MSANDVGVLKRSRPGLHLHAIDLNCHPGFGAGSIEKQDWLRPVPRTDHRIKGGTVDYFEQFCAISKVPVVLIKENIY